MGRAWRVNVTLRIVHRKLDKWAGALNRMPGLRSADKTRLVMSMAGESLSVLLCMPAYWSGVQSSQLLCLL